MGVMMKVSSAKMWAERFTDFWETHPVQHLQEGPKAQTNPKERGCAACLWNGGGGGAKKFVYQKWPDKISRWEISCCPAMVTLVWGDQWSVSID